MSGSPHLPHGTAYNRRADDQTRPAILAALTTAYRDVYEVLAGRTPDDVRLTRTLERLSQALFSLGSSPAQALRTPDSALPPPKPTTD